MVKCEICGKETTNPKEYGGKMLCNDCYVNVGRYYCWCRGSLLVSRVKQFMNGCLSVVKGEREKRFEARRCAGGSR